MIYPSPSDARRQILDACLHLAGLGYLTGTGGNLSMRCGDGLLAVTPSGLDYYRMAEDDVCIVQLDSLAPVEGRRPPSIETALHAAFLRARADAGAVVHTHQPVVGAVSVLNRSIQVEAHAARGLLGPEIRIVAYAPSGTKLLVRALRQRLAPAVNAYILRNHGFICCGETMNAALAATAEAERAAARFLRQFIEQAGPAGDLANFALESLK